MFSCDVCGVDLEPGYVPQTDARGRFELAVCPPCNDEIIRERAQRLGITEVRCEADQIVDEYLGTVYPREVRPRLGNA